MGIKPHIFWAFCLIIRLFFPMIKPVKCTSAPQFIVGHFKLKMCATNINNFGLSKKLFSKGLCRERMKFPIGFFDVDFWF